MGLYDTVHVSEDAASALGLTCSQCGKVPSCDESWQTKSLDAAMIDYVLRHDEGKVIRLFQMDVPQGRKYWRPWTAEEIAESNPEAQKGGRFTLWPKREGEGTYLPEAYLPENRRQRFMGELPHQWVEIYCSCSCGEFVEGWIKFCDGVAVEARNKPPMPPSGPGLIEG